MYEEGDKYASKIDGKRTWANEVQKPTQLRSDSKIDI